MKMFWFLPSALILLVTSSTVMEADAGKPSVYYIESPRGNFFMAPHMTINSSDARYIITKDVTNCTCKSACTTIGCKAWSVVKLDNVSAECRLSYYGPRIVTPVNRTNAAYFFTEDSVGGTYSFFRGDQLLYVELYSKLWFDAGKKACEDIPGHRLMILKTEVQFKNFKTLWNAHKSRGYQQDVVAITACT